jgi:hypothetical protein
MPAELLTPMLIIAELCLDVENFTKNQASSHEKWRLFAIFYIAFWVAVVFARKLIWPILALRRFA